MVDISAAQFEYDPDDPEGYRASVVEVGKEAGGQELSVRLFEIQPGQSLCPYHYEYVEEWLLVIEGDAVLRTPGGERPAPEGTLECFPAGPEGAHKVMNGGERPTRVLMWSSARVPAVAVYPDSDKIGVWVPGGADDVMIRREDGNVGYYEGEA